jgi:hypothetical protein
MPIIIGTVVTWISITVFLLIPKKLTLFEMIFLFCVDTIYELSIFSILHVNLKLIVVEPGISNGIADLMFRIIVLPLLLVITSNLLLFSNKKIKWCGVVLIVLITLILQQILIQINTLSFHNWNIIYSGITMCSAVVFSRIMSWVIRSLDPKETI